jgi:capsid protein
MPGHPDLETLWDEWAAAVKLTELLRTMCITKSRDGEAFCQITTRPGLDHPVKLFPLLIDSDRVQGNDAASEYDADGIRLDRFLEPVSYQVAKSLAVPDGFYTVMEPFMCHLFRKEMPEQFRGVSEIAPALPSIAMLRAYTIATLNKLEISSCVAGVLEPDVSVIDPDSMLYDIAHSERVNVNSYHHQAIEESSLPDSLRVVARADDGIVEAMEYVGESPFFLTIQWHPDKTPDEPICTGVLQAFADACHAFKCKHHPGVSDSESNGVAKKPV